MRLRLVLDNGFEDPSDGLDNLVPHCVDPNLFLSHLNFSSVDLDGGEEVWIDANSELAALVERDADGPYALVFFRILPIQEPRKPSGPGGRRADHKRPANRLSGLGMGLF